MVSLAKLNKILNFILLQTVWFALVVGVVYQHIWLGLGFFVAFVVWQLHPVNRSQSDIRLALTLAVLGLALDSLWLQLGLISYEMQWPYSFLAPVWILMLWIAFGLTVNHSLAWIFEYKTMGVLMGAIGGPLSYVAAQKFGAVTLNEPVVALTALAIGWTLVMLLIISLFSPAADHQRKLSRSREASWN